MEPWQGRRHRMFWFILFPEKKEMESDCRFLKIKQTLKALNKRESVAKKYAEMFGSHETGTEGKSVTEGGSDSQDDHPTHVKSSDGEVMEFSKIKRNDWGTRG